MSMRLMRLFARRVTPIHALVERPGHRVWPEVGKS
jgi:hypothetical protein